MAEPQQQRVGGIEHIDAGAAPRHGGMSARALLLGLAGVIGISILEPFNQNIFENTMLIGNHLPVSVMFLLFALVLVANPLLKGTKRFEPLTSAELVVIATMMFAACPVIWSGFSRLWAHQLVAPFYHNHERWQPLLDYVPDWLVPSADPDNQEVVTNFYLGEAQVPWGPWMRTAFMWSPFILAFFIGAFFLMALFRRQWEEAEKLPFPLATIALEAIRPPPPGKRLNAMFRSRYFWTTFIVVILLQMLYGWHQYDARIPEAVFKYDLQPALETAPWRHLPPHIKAKDAFIIVIGVTFFLSTEMSFSLWGFVVILAVVEMIGKSFQFPVQEHYNDHQIGAYIGYALVIVYVARRHLARAFRSIVQPGRAHPPSGHLSERAAALGFLICFLVASLWLSAAGLPLHVAILTAMIVFTLSLVVGRIIAESGLLFVQYNCWPHLFAESAAGPLISPQSHTLIHFTSIAPTMDQREGVMPYLFNSSRMAAGVEKLRSPRKLLFVWIGCLLLALMLSTAAQLSIVYSRGAILTDEWSGRILPEKTYGRSADYFKTLTESPERATEMQGTAMSHVGIGLAVVFALCFLRYRFLAWPLHPIGFLMAHTYPMQVFWLSILIGWACKWVVMRTGGVTAYRRLCPIFFAMIVATTFSSVFWFVVKILIYSAGQEGTAVLFLPS